MTYMPLNAQSIEFSLPEFRGGGGGLLCVCVHNPESAPSFGLSVLWYVSI